MRRDSELYLALKSILPSDYPIRFSYIDLSDVEDNKTVVTKNTAAMYFRYVPNDEVRDINGEYGQYTKRLLINVFTDRGDDGVLNGDDYCVRVCDILNKTFNKVITVGDTKVFIADCSNGGYQYVGPTKQGIAAFSINYLIKYY